MPLPNIQLPAWLQSAQSIAIVGFGREGKSTEKFIRTFLPHARTIVFETHQDEFTLPAVDVVFKSPGIPLKNLHFEGKPYITSQADLFTQLFGHHTIAVTGTKGKSTTAHVIARLFSQIGIDTLLVGNIGIPALDFIEHINDQTIVVFEMSSFQTESLHVAPHVGIFTSLYQDHLDYYDSYDEYKKAKTHLFDLQDANDICVYRCDDTQVVEQLADIKSKKIGYSLDKNEHAIAWIEVDTLTYEGNAIISTDSVQLKGKQSLVNMLPGIILAHNFPFTQNKQTPTLSKIQDALTHIEPLPGRLELVAIKNGIEFYDDALATIPEATIAAIDTLGDKVETLIVGGFDRNQDFEQLAEKIAHSSIKNLILLPTTGEKIAEQVCLMNPNLHCVPVRSMTETISACFAYTSPGKAALLSTASPSFGLFDDYRDRSSQYKECIKNHS